MSSTTPAAKRRRHLLLASSFLAPIMALGISGAHAQQTAAADQLPPIEVNPPGDQNRTRAKPTSDEGSGTRRVARRTRRRPSNPNPAPGTGSNVASQGDGQGGGGTPVRQFAGIVGTASTVITAKKSRIRPRKPCRKSSRRRRACS